MGSFLVITQITAMHHLFNKPFFLITKMGVANFARLERGC